MSNDNSVWVLINDCFELLVMEMVGVFMGNDNGHYMIGGNKVGRKITRIDDE
ncbi:hypothetical protein D3C86_1894950 [compost metagenome]